VSGVQEITPLIEAPRDGDPAVAVGAVPTPVALREAADPESLSPSERRLVRLAYDLHDGPLQDVAALAASARVLEAELAAVVARRHRGKMHSSFEDMAVRLAELERSLRELAEAFEPTSLVEQDLASALQREVEKASARTDVAVELRIEGELAPLTPSQRIAILRIVQESLANVCDHSGARRALVTVTCQPDDVKITVSDDGRGFDVSSTLDSVRRTGSLGLVGMRERVRLLGGKFDVRSDPGGGTTITLVLARWWPFKAQGEPGLAH